MQAQALGLAGLALTDRNSLAGIVRAHQQAKASRPALPGRLPARSRRRHLAAVLADRPAGLCPAQLAADPRQAAGGQGRLHADAGGRARPRRGAGLRPAAARRRRMPSFAALAPAAAALAQALSRPVPSLCRRRCRPASPDLAELARAAGLRPLATNDVHYHHPDRRPLQDVVTCIREHARIAEAGPAAVRQRRAPPQAARGDGAAVPRLPGGAGEHARDRRALPLLARRAGLRLSGPGRLRRPHARPGAGPAHLGRCAAGATRTTCRTRSSTSCGTSSS